MDTEVLISEVCKRRLLWDKNSKQHHNRLMLERAWTEIANYMDCSNKEARTKWKNLKDHFRKEYKKEIESQRSITAPETDPDETSTWSHYKSLLFLKDQVIPKKQQDTLESNLIDIKIENDDGLIKEGGERLSSAEAEETFNTVAGMKITQQDGEQVKLNLMPSEFSEDAFRNVKLKSLMKIQNKASSSSWGPPKKRQKIPDNNIKYDDAKYDGEKKGQKGNDNYHFVMTLLPHLDRLSSAKRLAVQIKIQQAVFSAIYGTNRSSSESTTSYDSTSSF